MLSRWQMRARVLVVFGMAAVALPARADEPADRGISMSAWAGAAVDRSVVAADSGRPLHDGAPLVGATALGNIRWVALGGTVDATPGINGDGRLSIGVLLGVQPEVDRIRIQVLGEAGRHRFSDVGGTAVRPPARPRHLVAVPRRSPRRRPHRARARDVRGGRLAVRALRHRRGDRHERRQLSWQETRTDYRLGGWMCGLALQVGLRLEAADPRRTEEMMTASAP